MEDEILSKALRVTNRGAAAALADAFRRHLALSLVGRKLSVTDVARAGKISLSLAYYHVRRLCALGLVEQASVQRRGGRAIRKYTARASAFFVPSRLLEDLPGTFLDRELRASLEGGSGSGMTGLLTYVGSDGAMRMRWCDASRRRRVPVDVWKILDLDEATADRLARELEDVLERYEGRKPSSRHRRYIVRCAIAERKGDHFFSA